MSTATLSGSAPDLLPIELADQERVWFGRYDLNDFRFVGVRKRKLAEERRKAAVPGR
jgi:hypothetical protein